MWNNKIIYIWGAGDDGKRILDNDRNLSFLSILENAGFDVNTGKAIFSAYQGMYRPMNQVGNRVSENIWAKRV